MGASHFDVRVLCTRTGERQRTDLTRDKMAFFVRFLIIFFLLTRNVFIF